MYVQKQWCLRKLAGCMRKWQEKEWQQEQRFNTLNGLLPFLRSLYGGVYWSKKCFNALNGLLPFLLNEPEKGEDSFSWFQRPKRASSISTPSNDSTGEIDDSVFQRPKRASSISTEKGNDTMKQQTQRFNALNGLLPFLLNNKWAEEEIPQWFQRPKRASSISTARRTKTRRTKTEKVSTP